jgi:hypothetical protein
MGSETSSRPSAKASTSGVKPALRGTKQPLPEDGDDDAYGDPSKVRDQGILESLGEAVSSPVRGEPERPSPMAPKAHKRSPS